MWISALRCINNETICATKSSFCHKKWALVLGAALCSANTGGEDCPSICELACVFLLQRKKWCLAGAIHPPPSTDRFYPFSKTQYRKPVSQHCLSQHQQGCYHLHTDGMYAVGLQGISFFPFAGHNKSGYLEP